MLNQCWLRIMLFSALGYFFPVFGAGNNLPSLICASIFLWFIAFLVSRGVKEATGINVVVTIAKLVPLTLFIVSIALLGNLILPFLWTISGVNQVVPTSLPRSLLHGCLGMGIRRY